MSRKSSDCYIPPDLVLRFVVPVIVILAGILLPVLSFLKTTEAIILYYTALVTGMTEVCCFSLRDCRFIANADFGLLAQAHCQNFTTKFTGWLMQ